MRRSSARLGTPPRVPPHTRRHCARSESGQDHSTQTYARVRGHAIIQSHRRRVSHNRSRAGARPARLHQVAQVRQDQADRGDG